jgi:hypothetical protein
MTRLRGPKIDSRAEMLAAENEPKKKSDGKFGAGKIKKGFTEVTVLHPLFDYWNEK